MVKLKVYRCQKCLKIFQCEYAGVVVECNNCPTADKGQKCYEMKDIILNDSELCDKCREVKCGMHYLPK